MSFFLNQHLVSWGRFNTQAWNIICNPLTTVIAILLDLWLILNVSQDVIQWHDYIIQHYYQHSIDIVVASHHWPWIPHATVMSHISPVSAISNQIDLQFTHDVSHMVTWALDYIIQHYHQHSIDMLPHNRPRIPQESIMTTFHPQLPYLFK